MRAITTITIRTGKMGLAAAVLVTLCGLVPLQTSCTGGQADKKKDPNMSEELRRMILDENWDAPQMAARLGRSASGVILPFTSSGSAPTRELAMACLNEIGGEAAINAFSASLDDSDINVRSRSVSYLLAHNSPRILPRLYEQLDSNKDESVREQIALVIGRIGQSSSIVELEKRVKASPSPGLNRSLRVALARLGQEPQRRETLAQLRSTDRSARVQALRDLEYIGDKRLLAGAAPLLNDRLEVLNLLPGPGRKMMRVCDVAVNVIARVTGAKFTFDARTENVFEPAQIEEARKVLAAQADQKS